MTKPVGALILAAGFSSRFGSLKLNAKLASGKTVIQQTLIQIGHSGLPSIVITRPELASSLQLDSARIEVFDGAAAGMGATLAFGISKALDWEGCLVCLADMPFIESSTYSQIALRLTASSIVLPCYHHQPGNPVGFGCEFFAHLQTLTGDSGGRSVTESNPDAVIELEVDDAAVLNDIDTPRDLKRLQELD